MLEQSNSESDLLHSEQYKKNLKAISKLYITKKFNPAYDLCEKYIKTFEIENLISIFDKIRVEEENEDEDEDYFLNKKKKEKKEVEEDIEEEKRIVIPSDLLQIYLKIIEQVKPETDNWAILNKFYKDVNEIPSKILTTCALIEVKKQNLEISKKNIKKWLREMPEEEKEKLREKKQPNFKFYEMLIEIYVLHVLAPLEEYNSSIDFLEGEDYLTMDRKKLICDKVIKIEALKSQEKLKAKNAKSNQKSPNKNLFSSIAETTSASTSTNDIIMSKDIDDNDKKNREVVKKSKSKQKKINNKHQNRYDIGNAVIDGSYDSFWKVLTRFLIDKAPFLIIIILCIVIKRNPEIIRGTIFERILKKLYETIMLIININ